MLSNSDNIIFDCLDLRQVYRLPKQSTECILNHLDISYSQPLSDSVTHYLNEHKGLKTSNPQPTIPLPNLPQQQMTYHTIAQQTASRCVRLLEFLKNIRKDPCPLRTKGRIKQTQNMGKRYKTITTAFLNMLIQAKVLDQSQSQAINTFNSRNGSLKDFQELFESQKLRKLCLDFFSSKNYISFILKSTKMDMRNKLMMVKHAQKLRSFTYNQTSGWKMKS